MAIPIRCARGEKYKRIAAADLYKVYEIFFNNQAASFEDDIKMVSIKRFKSIMVSNLFVVKRVNNRRGEIQGIKLNVTKVKGIFERGGKGSEFEDWFLSSVGARSDGYNLLFNLRLQQAVNEEKSQNREDAIQQDEKHNIDDGGFKKKLLELKKEKALLKRDNKKLERQLKEREKKVVDLQEKFDICWQSLEEINRKEIMERKE